MAGLMSNEASLNSDLELALQIACGEEEALRAFVAAHGPRVQGYLQEHFPAIADDAWQEALIRLMRKIDRYDAQQGPLGPWFLRLAQRCALSIIRAESKHHAEEVPEGLSQDKRVVEIKPPSSQRRKEMEQRNRQIRELIAALPPKERRVIEADLAHWQGRTLPSETAPAEALALRWGDTNANAIHQARSRARGKLRVVLESRGLFREESKP